MPLSADLIRIPEHDIVDQVRARIDIDLTPPRATNASKSSGLSP
jgi:hypothetical protein